MGTAYGLRGMEPQAALFRLWWNGAAVRMRQLLNLPCAVLFGAALLYTTSAQERSSRTDAV